MEIDDEEMEMRSSPPQAQREIAEKNEPIDTIDPVETTDDPRDITVRRKRPRWMQHTLHDAEGHEAPHGSLRESKRPQRFSSYVALMSHIIDSKPTTYEEAYSHQVWKDAMMEEYQSIMKNDVWEVVSRLEGNSVVNSKCLFKIKNGVYGSVEKHKARFVARGN